LLALSGLLLSLLGHLSLLPLRRSLVLPCRYFQQMFCLRIGQLSFRTFGQESDHKVVVHPYIPSTSTE
jgi:hypothetical protein